MSGHVLRFQKQSVAFHAPTEQLAYAAWRLHVLQPSGSHGMDAVCARDGMRPHRSATSAPFMKPQPSTCSARAAHIQHTYNHSHQHTVHIQHIHPPAGNTNSASMMPAAATSAASGLPLSSSSTCEPPNTNLTYSEPSSAVCLSARMPSKRRRSEARLRCGLAGWSAPARAVAAKAGW